MNENQMMGIMATVVDMICDKLTDLELAVLNNCVQLDSDPHGRLFDYETVKMLFTENNGTRAHDVTKEALARVVNARLEKAK